jgi:hypothetical protein
MYLTVYYNVFSARYELSVKKQLLKITSKASCDLSEVRTIAEEAVYDINTMIEPETPLKCLLNRLLLRCEDKL